VSDLLRLFVWPAAFTMAGLYGGHRVVRSTIRHRIQCTVCGFEVVRYHKLARHIRNAHGERISRRVVRKIAFTANEFSSGMGATMAILQRRLKEKATPFDAVYGPPGGGK
jgi:hypothetical protein